MEAEARRLVEAVRTAAAFPAPLILVICPPAEAAAEATVRHSRWPTWPESTSSPPCEVQALYPVAEVHDPHADQLGHLPYTPDFFAALATAIARKIHAISHAAVQGDRARLRRHPVGRHLRRGRARTASPSTRRAARCSSSWRSASARACCWRWQQEQRSTTCSRPSRAHPEMPLRLDDFAARRINWEPKGANLAALAEELELGLDSFILVDDNPKECTEAQAAAPEVLALPLPADAAEIPDFLRHVWAFDRARVTAEDRAPRAILRAARGARARRPRRRQPGRVSGLAAPAKFAFAPMAAARSRARGAAHPAHQPDERHAGAAQRGRNRARSIPKCLAVEVGDRFGDYGLSGVMIFRSSRGRAGGGYVPAELPRAGPRRGAPHGGAAGRNRPRARPGARGDSVRGRTSATGRRRCSWNPPAWRPPDF